MRKLSSKASETRPPPPHSPHRVIKPYHYYGLCEVDMQYGHIRYRIGPHGFQKLS